MSHVDDTVRYLTRRASLVGDAAHPSARFARARAFARDGHTDPC